MSYITTPEAAALLRVASNYHASKIMRAAGMYPEKPRVHMLWDRAKVLALLEARRGLDGLK